MNGRITKLLRKASGGDKDKYRLLVKLYPTLPPEKRTKARLMMMDLAELYRQQEEFARQHQIKYEPELTNKQRMEMRKSARAYIKTGGK